MNKLQKIALFNLSLATIGLLLQLLRFLVSDFLVHIITLCLTLILCCLLMASYFFRWRITKQDSLNYDERDKLIHKKAELAGAITMSLVISSVTIFTFLIVGTGGLVSIGLLLGIVLLSAMSLSLVESIAILIQYGLGGEDGEK